MRILFMGTSSFAVPALMKLNEAGFQIAGVITQPDKRAGRGRKYVYSPVKESALSLQLPVYQPLRIKDRESVDTIFAIDPQLIIVAAYGQIIPAPILDYPELGCVNIHASLLPKYRGAAPVQRALMQGDEVTGITIMMMDQGLDTGDIISQREVKIEEHMDHGILEELLAVAGARLLLDTIPHLKNKTFTRKKQDDKQATYAPRITRMDEEIQWADPAKKVYNIIRALSPAPGAFTLWQGQPLKLFSSRIRILRAQGTPGEVLSITDEGFWVQTGDGVLEILEVQRAGKKRMPVRDFLKGVELAPGMVLGH